MGRSFLSESACEGFWVAQRFTAAILSETQTALAAEVDLPGLCRNGTIILIRVGLRGVLGGAAVYRCDTVGNTDGFSRRGRFAGFVPKWDDHSYPSRLASCFGWRSGLPLRYCRKHRRL